MIPGSHPDEETLLAYTVGSMPPGGWLIVRVHLEYCAHCRGTIRFLDLLGGALMSGLPPAPVSSEVLERVLKASKVEWAGEDLPPRPYAPAELVRSLRHGPWKPFVPGVEFAAIEGDFDADETVCLLRGSAGSLIPLHGHENVERFVVLEGAFGLDETVYPAGDYIEADASVTHTPFIPTTTDCLCLFALQGGLIFPETTSPGS